MSGELKKAQAQYQAGEFKRAVDTLWEVTFVGDQAEADAREVLTLATLLREATQGGVRGDCEEHIARAERFLSGDNDPAARARAGRQLQQLREDAIRLAREAREAGLTWFELRREEDVVAAETLAAQTADAAGALRHRRAPSTRWKRRAGGLSTSPACSGRPRCRPRCSAAPSTSWAATSSTARRPTSTSFGGPLRHPADARIGAARRSGWRKGGRR